MKAKRQPKLTILFAIPTAFRDRSTAARYLRATPRRCFVVALLILVSFPLVLVAALAPDWRRMRQLLAHLGNHEHQAFFHHALAMQSL
jgi:hypothetical protein